MSTRERELDAQLKACADERQHASERLRSLPDALRTLQTRLADTLLKPLEETLRTELAPKPPPAAAETSEY